MLRTVRTSARTFLFIPGPAMPGLGQEAELDRSWTLAPAMRGGSVEPRRGAPATPERDE